MTVSPTLTNPLPPPPGQPSPEPGAAVPGLPVPSGGPGVCCTCHGPAPTGTRCCWCCRAITAALGRPCPPVVVGCCYRPGDRAHAALRGYKDAAFAAARRRFTAMVAATVTVAARSGIGTGVADAVCPVPPTRPRRAGTAPVLTVVRLSPVLRALPVVTLRVEPVPVGHLRADRRAFAPVSPVAGLRVLVVDDTWTTGAHARSAAAALEDAGATVHAIVVAGRCVDPTASAVAGRWWRRATEEALRSRAGRPQRAGDQALQRSVTR